MYGLREHLKLVEAVNPPRPETFDAVIVDGERRFFDWVMRAMRLEEGAATGQSAPWTIAHTNTIYHFGFWPEPWKVPPVVRQWAGSGQWDHPNILFLGLHGRAARMMRRRHALVHGEAAAAAVWDRVEAVVSDVVPGEVPHMTAVGLSRDGARMAKAQLMQRLMLLRYEIDGE